MDKLINAYVYMHLFPHQNSRSDRILHPRQYMNLVVYGSGYYSDEDAPYTPWQNESLSKVPMHSSPTTRQLIINR